MKEYGIYIKQGSGRPYMIHFFNNLDSAKFKVYEIVLSEEERGRPYFVDNDYFDNKYSLVGNLKYICIKKEMFLIGQIILNIQKIAKIYFT